MENQELLNSFCELLDEYAKHREYIARANHHAGKFNQAVIEKVVLEHEIACSELAEKVLPAIPAIEEAIATRLGDLEQIEGNKAGSDEQMQELELRLAIGEIDQEQFEAEGAELRGSLDSAGERIDNIRGEHEALAEALKRWTDLAAEAGQDPGVTGAPEADPVLDENSLDEGAVEDGDSSEEVEIGEASDEVEIGEASDEVEIGEDAEDDGSDDVAMQEESVEIVMEEEPEAPQAASVQEDESIELDVDDEVAAPEPAAPEVVADNDQRRAVLLQQEGTPDELIHPFNNDALTIGRGRDNDIQIKNDSKVSRFHCKLYKSGEEFYIEDNKSSNGSLVNGELITERRLFGGEELIIGETFFRFRIL
ncbi:MAG: FHA domain-containing protein [Myxococcota bacterium]|jgi:hypothetical protein|nr:FHA domain-containing protein [Myxococcota bacterium]